MNDNTLDQNNNENSSEDVSFSPKPNTDPNFPWDLKIPIYDDASKSEVQRLVIRRPTVGDYENFRNTGGDIADTYGQAAYFLRVCSGLSPVTWSKVDVGVDYNPLFRRMLNFLLLSQWEEFT